MVSKTLVVPGLHGSNEAHWQSWMERRIEGAERVHQSDWGQASLSIWSEKLVNAIERQRSPVWIIAHSFGCLVTAYASLRCADRIAGAMLVAPANPERFSDKGLEVNANNRWVSDQLPHRSLGFPVIVVASTNDPWMRFTTACVWAERWEAQLVNLGAVGHINVESGFGPWPDGLKLFEALREKHQLLPRGEFDSDIDRAKDAAPWRCDGNLQHAERAFARQWLG